MSFLCNHQLLSPFSTPLVQCSTWQLRFCELPIISAKYCRYVLLNPKQFLPNSKQKTLSLMHSFCYCYKAKRSGLHLVFIFHSAPSSSSSSSSFDCNKTPQHNLKVFKNSFQHAITCRVGRRNVLQDLADCFLWLLSESEILKRLNGEIWSIKIQ